MKKKIDKKIAFVLTFLLVAGILLIYAKLSFTHTGLVVDENLYDCGNWSDCVDSNQTRECVSKTNSSDIIIDVQDCETICTEDWICGNWSDCINSTQTRTCEDANDCGTEEDKPEESQECGVCGNGEIEVDEECDGDSTQNCTTTEGYAGTQNCSDCLWGECITTESCGDGIINGNEECDGTDITSSCEDEGYDEGTLSCNSDCTLNDDECAYEESSDNNEESSDNNEIPSTTIITTNTVQEEESSCTPNWDCGDWTECTDGTQDRVCTDINQCGSNNGMPETSQICIVEIKETCSDGIKNQDEKGIDCGGPCEKNCGFFTIVGSAIAVPVDAGKNFVLKGMFGNTVKTIISIVSLVLIIGGAVVFVLFKKNILKISLLKKLFQKKDFGDSKAF